ncbi:hypothetical protein ACHAW5_008989 [Stephanodiscus triporus]|uniref:Dynactin subunit 5 n=1 Tax=Stephanodiscus triporus TaxID=2934178 RepID=A0ABD3PIA3_9STRA
MMMESVSSSSSAPPEQGGSNKDDVDRPPPPPPPPPEKSSDYIRTAAQNYISRNATIHGPANLVTGGRSVIRRGVVMRGDYGVAMSVGRYSFLDEGVVVAPCVVPRSSDPLLPSSPSSSSSSSSSSSPSTTTAPPPPGSNERAIPVAIGSHTYIGRDSVINSISVGSCVHIGSNCVLMSRTKVHDCCLVEDGTILPPDAIVPPFSRVRGDPTGMIVGSLPECAGVEFAEGRVRDYHDFVRGGGGGGEGRGEGGRA